MQLANASGVFRLKAEDGAAGSLHLRLRMFERGWFRLRPLRPLLPAHCVLQAVPMLLLLRWVHPILGATASARQPVAVVRVLGRSEWTFPDCIYCLGRRCPVEAPLLLLSSASGQ